MISVEAGNVPVLILRLYREALLAKVGVEAEG